MTPDMKKNDVNADAQDTAKKLKEAIEVVQLPSEELFAKLDAALERAGAYDEQKPISTDGKTDSGER